VPELPSHPRQKQFCAWITGGKGEAQCVAALEISPVESPIAAVRAAIAAEMIGKK